MRDCARNARWLVRLKLGFIMHLSPSTTVDEARRVDETRERLTGPIQSDPCAELAVNHSVGLFGRNRGADIAVHSAA